MRAYPRPHICVGLQHLCLHIWTRIAPGQSCQYNITDMANAGRVPPLDFSSLALEVAAGGEAAHSPVRSDTSVAEAGGAGVPFVYSEAVSRSDDTFNAVHHEAVSEEASSDRTAGSSEEPT
eukprot:2636429-Amphidinium_carterae.1